MDPLKLMLVLFQFHAFVCGKHISMKDVSKRKTYPRQMIIPNKFIPMLKESALFKSRSSSNDLSDFLKPKPHTAVTGQTRQNLMNAMGMDTGPSPGDGGFTPGGMGPGSMGVMQGGMPGMAAMGGSEGVDPEGGVGEGGGLGGLGKIGGAMGGIGGMNDQVNGMNSMDGMPNLEGGDNPLQGQMAGNNAMNSMNSGGPEGMMSDSNNLPAGDPMGTLKAMLDNQGTNAALGTNAEAFGPGGSANSNILAMLNQIVGKEMPGESPVDPSSRSQQMWDQMEKGLSNQRAALIQPYLDSPESKNSHEAVQQDAPVNHAHTNNPAPSPPPAPPANSGITKAPTTSALKPPVYNLTLLEKSVSGSHPKNLQNNPAGTAPEQTSNAQDTNVTNLTLTKLNSKIKSQAERLENGMAKTTSNPAEIDLDDDKPLSDDMVKFLKGIKFVVAQEPGNDIILGKKFTSYVPAVSTDLKEENGVMKNIVSENHKEGKVKNIITSANKKNKKSLAIGKDLKGIDLSFARNLLLRRNVYEDFAEYKKAAKVLERASTKLKDPIAKKSTEIAIASILKVLASQNKEKTTPGSTVDALTGGDVKNALSEKYFEAARVLGTASKKLADPVAKKSAEIGIASILKIIALGNYSVSKKDLVPISHHNSHDFNTHAMTNEKKNLIAAAYEVAHQLTMASNLESNVYN